MKEYRNGIQFDADPLLRRVSDCCSHSVRPLSVSPSAEAGVANADWELPAPTQRCHVSELNHGAPATHLRGGCGCRWLVRLWYRRHEWRPPKKPGAPAARMQHGAPQELVGTIRPSCGGVPPQGQAGPARPRPATPARARATSTGTCSLDRPRLAALPPRRRRFRSSSRCPLRECRKKVSSASAMPFSACA